MSFSSSINNTKFWSFNLYTDSGLIQVIVDTKLFNDLCVEAIYKVRYSRIPDGDDGIIIIGKDIISRVCQHAPDNMFADFSNNDIAGFGYIFDSSIQGISVLSKPQRYSNHISRELTDRERMSQAHLTTVAKMTNERGSHQRGEYRDGWMSCLRFMCGLIGIKVPDNVPFEGMKTVSIEEITKRVREKIQNA